MCISVDKSSFLYNNVDVDIRTEIAKAFPYKMETITAGFMYLGYFIKPLGYRVRDWHWLIQKFEHRISHWAHKIISLGVHLTLVQAVLTSISVYWMGLAPIPVSVLRKLKSLAFAFHWGSSDNKRRYHLTN